MTTKTIGKDCKCIYPFDRHYIKLALDKLIEEKNKEIRNIRERAKMKIIKDPEPFIRVFERSRRNTETVKKRLENIPICE